MRALAFDKSDRADWALGWHQDRTIEVEARADTPRCTRWTIEQGLVHVEPPFGLHKAMVTIRCRLDDIDEDDGPLRVALGTHRLGWVSEDRIVHTASSVQTLDCHGQAGDVWATSTPILHASDQSAPGRRHRIVQIDDAAADLPHPQRWQGP